VAVPFLSHILFILPFFSGVKKRMAKMTKTFPIIQSWKRSIINHLYWSAVTSDNDGVLIVAKWKSLANHIINKHDHENEHFPMCLHGQLPPRRWFDPGKYILFRVHTAHGITGITLKNTKITNLCPGLLFKMYY
jgi:hypothetical protein